LPGALRATIRAERPQVKQQIVEIGVLCGAGGAVLGAALGVGLSRLFSRRDLTQRLSSFAARLGGQAAADSGSLENALAELEVAVEQASLAVAEAGQESVALRRALDLLPLGVAVFDRDLKGVLYNKSFPNSLDSPEAGYLAAQVTDLLKDPEEDKVKLVSIHTPSHRTYELRKLALDNAGRPIGYLVTVADVTEQRRAEELRRDLVANVSHELQTPVGAIQLLAETLAGEKDPAIQRRLAARVHEEAARLAKLVADLLSLATLESGTPAPAQAIPLSEAISAAYSKVATLAEQRKIVIDLPAIEEDILVMANRPQLVAAIYNLLDNAVKYSEEGGRVRVICEKSDQGATIGVQDEGVGIPAADLERIFERFYRVDQARSRDTGGAGLGLSIVKHVAMNHGGTVRVESVEGKGSTFYLTLPLAEP
jgi:two-component system sensor histidine kinase SenX3